MGFKCYFFVLGLLNYLCQSVVSISKHPILIVVSYDAFRYDYINPKDTPNMYRLMQEGASTHHVTSIFPTKTFPNHFSIATGLYADSHGVTGNSLYDPKLKKVIGKSYELYHYNEHVEPIWIRNEKLGDGRYSGIMMWPGGTYAYQNVTPTFNIPWNRDITPERRADMVVSWITHPTTPANLVFMYIEEPDFHSHCFGINSTVFYETLHKLDNATKYLDELLKFNGIQDKVNVVHLSDHGMVNIKHQNIINITHVLEPGSYQTADTSPFLHIIPSEEKEKEVYYKLKNLSVSNGHFQVFNRSEMPDRWHFRNNERVPTMAVLGEVGYVFQDFWEMIERYTSQFDNPMSPHNEHGVHGYDNLVPQMAGFFMARGPAFKKRFINEPFNNVDYYNLFSSVLKLRPRPNNGTFDNIARMLASHKVIRIEEDKNYTSFLAMCGGASECSYFVDYVTWFAWKIDTLFKLPSFGVESTQLETETEENDFSYCIPLRATVKSRTNKKKTFMNTEIKFNEFRKIDLKEKGLKKANVISYKLTEYYIRNEEVQISTEGKNLTETNNEDGFHRNTYFYYIDEKENESTSIAVYENSNVVSFYLKSLTDVMVTTMLLLINKSQDSLNSLFNGTNFQESMIYVFDSSVTNLSNLFGGIVFTTACLGCVGSSMLCMVKQKRQTESLSLAEKRYSDEIQYSAHLQHSKVEAQQLLLSDSDDDSN